jgi:hypothetical protein
MGNAQDIRAGNKFAAVPEGNRGSHGLKIDAAANQENENRNKDRNPILVLVPPAQALCHYHSPQSSFTAHITLCVPERYDNIAGFLPLSIQKPVIFVGVAFPQDPQDKRQAGLDESGPYGPSCHGVTRT